MVDVFNKLSKNGLTIKGGNNNSKSKIMKIIRCLAPAALFLSMQMAEAQPTYSQNVVGWLNTTFVPGYTLFANPLDNGGDNTLTNLIPTAPNNTTVSLWNSATSSFDTTSRFRNGRWSLNLTISPGTGAELFTTGLFTNSFVGSVVTRNGVPLDFTSPPPVYSGPDGTLLLGDLVPMVPTTDIGTNIFFNILGRAPNPGEQVKILDPSTQIYTTSTYLGNDTWDTATPTLNAGQAALLTVVSVPEPSSLALAGFGATVMTVGGRLIRRKPA